MNIEGCEGQPRDIAVGDEVTVKGETLRVGDIFVSTLGV